MVFAGLLMMGLGLLAGFGWLTSITRCSVASALFWAVVSGSMLVCGAMTLAIGGLVSAAS